MQSSLPLLPLVASLGCRCGAPSAESDPDSEGPVGAAVEVAVSLAEDTELVEAATLGLVFTRFGEGPALGETLASAPAALGTVSLQLPAAPPLEQLALLDHQGDGVQGALYLPVVFVDQSADGAFQEGEPLLGAALDRWLLWHERDQVDTAGPQTWRLVDLGISGQFEPNRCALDSTWPLEWFLDSGYPQLYELSDGLEILLRGLTASAQLAGAVQGLPEGDWRLAGLPYPHFTERSMEAVLDVEVPEGQGSFSVQLEQAPPDEHDVGADPDWGYTMHLLLLYGDSDGSGGWSEGDELEGSTTCSQGETTWARYTRPVDSYRGYRFLECYGGTVGWRAARTADSGAVLYLSSAEASQLVLDGADCRVD